MTFRFGNLTLDTESRALTRDGRPIAISPKAFKLLQILLEERPRAIPKAELHRRLWPDTVVSEVNLPTLIAEIRQAIGDGARAPEFIRTVYGYGYAFCGSAVAMSRDGRLAVPSDQVFRLLWGQREVALSEGENVLGRGTDSLVWIDAQSVSRRHARVMVASGLATLEDLGSKNGTFVNGIRLASPIALRDGDELRIGNVPMTLKVYTKPSSTETATGY
ncbi:MAG TPA: FHA domain-containing protein [Thermoanaerobaculia bacterium]|jgi:DNA-binding winged helix-turn-helix (wHTH) protein|nr:FHA domain-containing protein [Thermoanaerobaculia bacterium]